MDHKIPQASLQGEIAIRARELIREICHICDVEIIKGPLTKDHVDLMVSVPPHVSVSRLVQYIKGKSSRKMMMEFKTLSRMFWGRHIWVHVDILLQHRIM